MDAYAECVDYDECMDCGSRFGYVEDASVEGGWRVVNALSVVPCVDCLLPLPY